MAKKKKTTNLPPNFFSLPAEISFTTVVVPKLKDGRGGGLTPEREAEILRRLPELRRNNLTWKEVAAWLTARGLKVSESKLYRLRKDRGRP